MRALNTVCHGPMTQALILTMLLVPGITANPVEITKRWAGSTGLVRLEFPATEPEIPLQRPLVGGSHGLASGGRQATAYGR